MKQRSSIKKSLVMLVLTLACLGAGFGFHKAFGGDVITSGAFTFGVLGIMLSVGRNLKI